MMMHMMEPTFFTTEIVYAAAIITICAVIYAKTKDLYRLSGHEGIRHFREAFLFFALAYLFRLIPVLFRLAEVRLPGYRIGFVAGYALFGYASSMAVISIARSITWKRLRKGLASKDATYHAIAALIGAMVLASGSTTVLFLTQSALIIGAAILAAGTKQRKGLMHYAYPSLLLFWMLNIAIIMTPLFQQGLRSALYAASLAIFIIILTRVLGRTRG